MVTEPEQRDDGEADPEADQAVTRVVDLIRLVVILTSVAGTCRFDREKGDGDREHRVAEEQDAVELDEA